MTSLDYVNEFQNRKRYEGMRDLHLLCVLCLITKSNSFKTVNGMEACVTAELILREVGDPALQVSKP